MSNIRELGPNQFRVVARALSFGDYGYFSILHGASPSATSCGSVVHRGATLTATTWAVLRVVGGCRHRQEPDGFIIQTS